ncbi:MAG: hypothetical protein JWQ81_5122 [Amycolatopsis sp.]|uniref:hypothetical protein n=1 Tax=Amycolatopsis sp. TaxID=37632 RepID=UPI00260F5ED8|nr:hypothetical protein [Amycolatopsis sp.]MCU1684383.1 hypothetical protein [Amycolatopsis sp.]
MAYVTLPTFVGYSIRSGPARMSFVRRYRRMFEDPQRAAFNFYRRAASAIREGRESGRDKESMMALVDQANAVSLPHYTAVAEGWLRYLGRRKPEVVEVGQSRWRHKQFESRISPQLGLRKASGQEFVTWLYFKDEPLTRNGANLALWSMEQVMDDLRPGATALVVDVRRAKEFTLTNRDRARMEPWVRSEASSFLTLWEAAA